MQNQNGAEKKELLSFFKALRCFYEPKNGPERKSWSAPGQGP
jgi:hypothetical protein